MKVLGQACSQHISCLSPEPLVISEVVPQALPLSVSLQPRDLVIQGDLDRAVVILQKVVEHQAVVGS